MFSERNWAASFKRQRFDRGKSFARRIWTNELVPAGTGTSLSLYTTDKSECRLYNLAPVCTMND